MKVRIVAYDPDFLDQFEREATASAVKLLRERDAIYIDLPNKLDAAFTRLAELGTIMFVMPGESIEEATDGELDEHTCPTDGEHFTVVVKPD